MKKAATLTQMQRWAETDARRLGLAVTVVVRWGGEHGSDGLGGVTPAACARGTWSAHAHVTEARRDGIATVCVHRGHGSREVIRHEMAHFAPGGDHHGEAHLRQQVRLGSRGARSVLVRLGKARCPKHRWQTEGMVSQQATRVGLVIVYRAACVRCGKHIGEPKAA